MDLSGPVWREEIIGYSLGILFLSVFGFVWASLGTSSLPGSTVFLVAAAAVSLALISSGLYFRRNSSSLPSMPQNMMRPGTMKRFRMVFIIEGVAIAVSVFVLGRVGHPEWIPSVVALIVGIHFFPLAPLFRVRMYHVTGALLCLVFLLTFVLASLSGTQNLWFIVPGIGSALVLWGTASVLAFSGIRSLRSG